MTTLKISPSATSVKDEWLAGVATRQVAALLMRLRLIRRQAEASTGCFDGIELRDEPSRNLPAAF
jgi:hypothetical protein